MATEIDFYEVLGIAPSADLDAIKRAYREQMRRHHPDAFLGQMAKARQSGDVRELRQLERRIEESKRRTQVLNLAYDVLSDATKRQTYDMRRAGVPQQRAAAYYPEDDPYRAGPYASRDYHNPTRRAAPRPAAPRPRPVNDSFPLALFVVLGFGLLFVTGTLIGASMLPARHGDLPIANDGRISAHDLQLTQIFKNTETAVAQIAARPTLTPSPPGELMRRGDALSAQGSFSLAVEMYSRAISQGHTGDDVFLRRGVAYLALGDPLSLEHAIADFDRAEAIDPHNPAIYLERAVARAGLYVLSRDPALAEQVRADAKQFIALGGTRDARLERILAELR